MFLNKKKIIVATLSLAMGCSFGFNSYAFANAEETVIGQQETIKKEPEKKVLSQAELQQIDVIKRTMKENIRTYNDYVEKRQRHMQEDVNRNTANHQNVIKTYRLKIATYMSSGVLSKSDKRNIIFYRNMIQKEKENCNKENNQIQRKADEDMLRVKDKLNKQNAELKEKLKTILGDNADDVIITIENQATAYLDDLEENILE